jgi:hypothetical protein
MAVMPILLPYRYQGKFPDLPASVPMSILDEDIALANHGQTLARLAERGGLSPVEIMACHTRAPLRSLFAPNTTEAAVPELLKLLASLPSETS